MFKRFLIIFSLHLLSISLLLSSVFALNFPKPTGFVNDFAQVLTPETKQQLEAKLSRLEKDTSHEIAVVTVSSLEGTTVEDYAVRLFENWKIGKKNKDNGVLLLVAPSERKVRIEVGYGLEPTLTDSKAGRIIRNIIIPEFKSEDYDAGISKGVETIISSLSGDEDVVGNEPIPGFVEPLFPFIIFFLILLFSYLAAFLGRSKEIWPGGAIGVVLGGAVGFFFSTMIVGFFAAIFSGAIGLFLDFILSRNYQKRKKKGLPTSWASSRGGFSSGGRSGFGGFSGGSSGGGGTSGSW